MKVAFDSFSLLFGVMFYMSRILGTNVLIALNKLIESKSISGVMLLPPTQLEATGQHPAGPASSQAQGAKCHLLHPNPCQPGST